MAILVFVIVIRMPIAYAMIIVRGTTSLYAVYVFTNGVPLG